MGYASPLWQLGGWEAVPNGDPNAGMASRPGQRRAILNEPGNYYYGDDDPAPAADASTPPPDPGPAPPPAPMPAPMPAGGGGGGGGTVPVPPPSTQSLSMLSRPHADQPGFAVGERDPEIDRTLTDRVLPASSRALSQLAAQRGGRIY